MRKIILILLTIISVNVYASTTTYERTEDDLRVNDWVVVTDSNKYNIMNTPSVDETEKIYDFADLLTDEEEDVLYEKVKSFIENYDMDLALVTIDDNFESAMEYADDFYDYNNFGIGKNRAGLLVLIDMDTREFYISTTGEAILMYDDYRIDSILDDMTYYMKNGYYYDALDTSVDSIEYYAKEGIPEDNKKSYIDEYGNYVYVENKKYPVLPFLFVSGIASTIILIIFILKNRLVKKAYEAGLYLDENKKEITNIKDRFVTSHTSRIYIASDSSSSGGNSSGSSTHSSSSGSSHGGGGRSF